jgi:hypothetical protein
LNVLFDLFGATLPFEFLGFIPMAAGWTGGKFLDKIFFGRYT